LIFHSIFLADATVTFVDSLVFSGVTLLRDPEILKSLCMLLAL
jgi:hypothetical protein